MEISTIQLKIGNLNLHYYFNLRLCDMFFLWENLKCGGFCHLFFISCLILSGFPLGCWSRYAFNSLELLYTSMWLNVWKVCHDVYKVIRKHSFKISEFASELLENLKEMPHRYFRSWNIDCMNIFLIINHPEMI